MCRSMMGVVCGLLSATAALPAQQGGAATGSVTGHVLCADTHRPARMASVYLLAVPQPATTSAGKTSAAQGTVYLHVVQTSLDGSFTIARVRPGNYYLVADGFGYIAPLDVISREQMSKPDKATADLMSRLLTPVSVAARHVTPVEATIYRGGVLHGTVRFDDGTPVAHASLGVSRRTADGKWTKFATQPTHQDGSWTTDDEGHYRLSGLPGGEYLPYVSLGLNELDVMQGPTSKGMSVQSRYDLQVYLGDSFRESAGKAVKLSEGEDAAAADLTVPLAKLHAVHGTVVRKGSGQVVNAAKVSLRWSDTGQELTSVTVSEDDDAFHFEYVPEGEYTLHVSEVRELARTEVPNCEGCVPQMRTEEKLVERFGDADQALVVQTDEQAITIAVMPAGVNAVGPAGVK